MSLVHEVDTTSVGYAAGDMKMATYSIAFTANQFVQPETGWILLNGSVVAQATYPILFVNYGSIFNTGGEGVGNFRLPDLTDGKVPIAKGLSSFTSYGAAAGEITHVLTAAELYSHVHGDTFSATASAHGHSGSASINAASSSHQHTGNSVSIGGPGYGTGSGISDAFDTGLQSPASGPATHSHSASGSINNNSSPNLTVGGSISATGGGAAHNNMQPYLVMGGWLVRAG